MLLFDEALIIGNCDGLLISRKPNKAEQKGGKGEKKASVRNSKSRKRKDDENSEIRQRKRERERERERKHTDGELGQIRFMRKSSMVTDDDW